jgi:hypothetical protein
MANVTAATRSASRALPGSGTIPLQIDHHRIYEPYARDRHRVAIPEWPAAMSTYGWAS